jgi:hypothetical protein
MNFISKINSSLGVLKKMFSIAFLTDWDGYEPEIFPDSRSVPQKNPFAEYNVRYIWACGAHMLHRVRLKRHVSVSGYWSLLYVPRRALQLATSHRIHSNVNIIFSSVRNEYDSVNKRGCRLSSTILVQLIQ